MARYTKSEVQDWAWETLRAQWTTLITPFTPDNAIDEEGMRRNIRHIRKLGTRGAGCTWGMGEFWSLTHNERVQVMDILADEAKGQWPIGAHVTHTSAPEMLALAGHAEAVGFDLLIVAPPYFVTKTEEQVIDYVRLLADNTSMAIMFYNSPQFGIVLSPQALKRVCQIPNVVGVKEASFNQQLSIEAHLTLGKESIISTPDEWIFWKAKELGFQQQVMFANTSDWRFDTPECNYYVQFIDRATKGDLDEQFYETHLRRIKELSDTWWTRTVTKYNGALPVSVVKYWSELMGMAGGEVRPPLANLAPEEKAALAKSHGCDHPILYRHTDFAEAVMNLTGGTGVTVVYDAVGKDTFEKGLGVIAERGWMVVYGQASGPVPPLDTLRLAAKGINVTRGTLNLFVHEPAYRATSAAELFGLIADGVLKVEINQRYPLAETARAHADLEGRKTTGSTVLDP